jgi:hypothetical protein
MPIENLPEDQEDIIDIAAKAGYLKVDTGVAEIKLNSHNQIEIQPKGTIFGAKIKVDQNGNTTPTLTFDTKKLRDPKNNINAKDLVDDALDNFFNSQ